MRRREDVDRDLKDLTFGPLLLLFLLFSLFPPPSSSYSTPSTSPLTLPPHTHTFAFVRFSVSLFPLLSFLLTSLFLMAVHVRAAEISDRDAILGALSDGIYGGHDYLPLRYDQWFADDESHFLFVAASSSPSSPPSPPSPSSSTLSVSASRETIAGFTSVALLDGGR